MLQSYDLTTGEPIDRLPDLDVHEAHGELILRARMPGLSLGALGLGLDQGDLIVDADGWKSAAHDGGPCEHLHGRLPLPFSTDPAAMTGRVEDDVLEVHILLPPLPDGEAWLPGEEIAY